jgi:phosphatidylglycerol lysyltransferase
VYGLFIIGSTLVGQFKIHRLHLLSYFSIDVHILFGLGFVYLSLLLLKRKRNALYLATVAFAVLLADGIVEIALHPASHKLNFAITVNYIILPVIITAALILYRNEFKVKSDFQTFMGSIKLAVVVIIITLMYGVSGFLLMDKSDFHQEIGFTSALHHTVDQFDLTTSQPLIAYTKRAQLFLHSLSIISIGSIVFLMISLVQPVKSRLGNDEESRKRINSLMERFGAPSEDFFKLWPRDKHYFFDSSGNAALAYKTKRGVALILADPVGDENSFKQLLREFHDMCWSNDWQPALIHVDAKYKWLYRKSGYQLQLIGQEAFVNVEHFCKQTRNNKYFRNIVNRFGKEGYTFEILNPPHNKAKVNRLRVISDEWLSKPGRTERGFVMGYFSEEYLQKCSLAVVKDSARNIQAFLNIIPSTSFNRKEVTYDMLRAAKSAPPNVNDFLLLSLIDWTDVKGYKTLNMGLSPLIGLDDSQADNGLITSVLRFAYTNGDRFYSFSGLKRFKSKYEPEWVDKMIGFKGGLRGFSKAMNALLPAMSVSSGLKRKSD